MIAVTTICPYLVMPAAVHYGSNVEVLVLMASLLSFVGGHAHVSATAFFYSDPEMRRHFAAHRFRYLLAPALTIAGTGIAYMLVPEPHARYILLFYFLWQTHHYQRQNVGVLSFFAAGTDRVPLSRLERLSLEVAAIAGMLSLIKLFDLGRGTLLEPFTGQIFQVAQYIYLCVPVLVVAAFLATPTIIANRLRSIGLVAFSAFFVPSFIFSDPAAAVLGYALGHGLQYLVFMYFVGMSRPRRVIALATILVAGVLGGLLLTYMTNHVVHTHWLGRLAFGAALGVVMSHFIIDAGIWKLRHPFQRQYVKRAFSFVFER
ncbi:MAG: hypothetical protein U1E60_22405 [Reyranellaceae bacterium]